MTTGVYADLMGYECCRPNCAGQGFGKDIQVHHIFPQKRGGPDEAWNYLCVCPSCHRVAEACSRRGNFVTPFSWKSRAEVNKYGFVLDEREENDCKKLNQLLHARGLSPARYFPSDPLQVVPAIGGRAKKGNNENKPIPVAVDKGIARKDRGQRKQRINEKANGLRPTKRILREEINKIREKAVQEYHEYKHSSLLLRKRLCESPAQLKWRLAVRAMRGGKRTARMLADELRVNKASILKYAWKLNVPTEYAWLNGSTNRVFTPSQVSAIRKAMGKST